MQDKVVSMYCSPYSEGRKYEHFVEVLHLASLQAILPNS
jgi:hypothetical protein